MPRQPSRDTRRARSNTQRADRYPKACRISPPKVVKILLVGRKVRRTVFYDAAEFLHLFVQRAGARLYGLLIGGGGRFLVLKHEAQALLNEVLKLAAAQRSFGFRPPQQLVRDIDRGPHGLYL